MCFCPVTLHAYSVTTRKIDKIDNPQKGFKKWGRVFSHLPFTLPQFNEFLTGAESVHFGQTDTRTDPSALGCPTLFLALENYCSLLFSKGPGGGSPHASMLFSNPPIYQQIDASARAPDRKRKILWREGNTSRR